MSACAPDWSLGKQINAFLLTLKIVFKVNRVLNPTNHFPIQLARSCYQYAWDGVNALEHWCICASHCAGSSVFLESSFLLDFLGWQLYFFLFLLYLLLVLSKIWSTGWTCLLRTAVVTAEVMREDSFSHWVSVMGLTGSNGDSGFHSSWKVPFFGISPQKLYYLYLAKIFLCSNESSLVRTLALPLLFPSCKKEFHGNDLPYCTTPWAAGDLNGS